MLQGSRFFIGIDEVGRGALAGPVVVAAVRLPVGYYPRISKPDNFLKLKDSKKLTKLKREAWTEYIKRNPRISFALARVYPRKIDRINISRAANLAATNALIRLLRNSNGKTLDAKVFLDGGLYVFEEKIFAGGRRFKKLSVRTVIKGDEKYTSVKLASIIAKVHRDNYLTRLKNKYPDFGFDIHKGYGTKKHIAEIKKFGATDVHRKNFIKNL